MLNLRDSIKEDATFLGTRLREADLEELMVAEDETSSVALLEEGIENSDNCWTILYEDTPVAIFGNNQQTIWMMATDELLNHKIDFLRRGRNVCDQLTKDLGGIYAASYYKNQLHHKWLFWLGFEYKGRHDQYFIFQKDDV